MNGPVVYFIFGIFSFMVTFFFTKILVPRLKRFDITGRDVNKPGRPEVAEMGGIGIVAGFTAGILLAIFFNTFLDFEFNLIHVLAALITIHSLAFIGIVDDLLDVPQYAKAFFPLFAAIPLVALSAAGSTSMTFPFIGSVDLGIFYVIVLVPIGIAVASNLTNMLAGFNGLEAGMGSVMFAVMSIIAIAHGSPEMAILFVPMLGALVAFLFFNWYPAKVFPGDVGNLTIGAVLASGVIIGNMETAGAILMVPYVVDFFIKAYKKFPSSNWWGDCRMGKLYPLEGRIRGFAQLVMKIFRGISEVNLVLFFVGIEIIIGVIVLALYL
jgi:UDP-N-acetylglucosamine--dolichyl-phosphate N-acetylglucosaminephosphotransferase